MVPSTVLLFQKTLSVAGFCGPSKVDFKRLCSSANQSLPVLYDPASRRINVEHVVPISILHAVCGLNYTFLNDPYNMHLADSRLNSIRSNYRFLFTHEPHKHAHMKAVGNSNYVSHKYKMFTPHVRDWPSIFRAVTHCHNTYGVEYDKVIVGGKPSGCDLQALYKAVFNERDLNHAILCAKVAGAFTKHV